MPTDFTYLNYGLLGLLAASMAWAGVFIPKWVDKAMDYRRWKVEKEIEERIREQELRHSAINQSSVALAQLATEIRAQRDNDRNAADARNEKMIDAMAQLRGALESSCKYVLSHSVKV